MITLRPATERGPTRLGWLDSRHTFSFGHYYDPRHMGWGPLRVINEDIVAPGGGFATHGHANMEIVTCVLAGALAHKDSLGTGSVIRPGEVQRMSAGTGIEHSEYNASATEPVHFLQIWIQPDRINVAPGYEQKAYPQAQRRDQLCLMVSPDGQHGSIRIHQDATIHGVLLSQGKRVAHALGEGRRAWLQVASGAVSVNGQRLGTGDGASAERQSQLVIEGVEDAELLLFDLP